MRSDVFEKCLVRELCDIGIIVGDSITKLLTTLSTMLLREDSETGHLKVPIQARSGGRRLGEEVRDLHTSEAQPGDQQPESHRVQHQPRDAAHLQRHRLAVRGVYGREVCEGKPVPDVPKDFRSSASSELCWILRDEFLSVAPAGMFSVAPAGIVPARCAGLLLLISFC